MGQILKFSQIFSGSQNGNNLSATMRGTVNTQSGECSAFVKVNSTDDPEGIIVIIKQTITVICGGSIIPRNGAENISDLITQPNFVRTLTYTFMTGEQLVFTSDVNLRTNSCNTLCSGNYPGFLKELIAQNSLITMAEPATMKMFNTADDSGITYQGRMKLLISGNIIPVSVESKYVFSGARLAQDQSIFFENGATEYDSDKKTISKFVKVTITTSPKKEETFNTLYDAGITVLGLLKQK